MDQDDKQRIYEEEKARLEAHEKLKGEKKKQGCIGCLALFVIFAAIGLIMDSCSGNKTKETGKTANTQSTSINNPQTTTNSTGSSPVETKKDNAIQPGMYKIGKDIPAGEYIITSNGSSGYFELTKDSSGQLDSIICNDMFENRSIITVKDGEYLKIQSSRAYTIDNSLKAKPSNDILPSGMYKVGLDLNPGEYKIKAKGDGYVEVTNNSRHALTGIFSNDMFSGEKYVTVTGGQYIKLQKAELVLK